MKKNVASQNIAAQMNSRTDGSPLTSSVSVAVTIDGGTSTAGGGTLTHEAAGHWNYAPTQAETNGDHVAFQFTHASGINQVLNVYPTFPQTGDNFARIGAPVGASISADVAAVKAETASIQSDTNDIQTRIPAALVSGRIDASVGAMASGVLTATAIAGDAITAAKLASDVTTELQSGLATASALSTVAGYLDTEVAAIKAVTDKLDTAMELDTAVYRFTTNALEQAPSGSGASAADIADAVWDEALSGHLGSGSTGEALNAAGAAGDPWITALPGAYSSGQAGYILGTNLNATVSSRATQTSLDAVDDYVDTEIAAIKAKTDNLPSDPADASVVAGLIAAVETKVDTAITDIAAVPTAIENADALLARDIGSGTGAGTLNERTVRSALRFPRNKYTVSGGTLTVMKEDDSTTAWTAAVTGTAGADPVTGSDPT